MVQVITAENCVGDLFSYTIGGRRRNSKLGLMMTPEEIHLRMTGFSASLSTLAIQLPQKLKIQIIIVNLSGRGDKDVARIAEYLEEQNGN